jgi:hypothetical protein
MKTFICILSFACLLVFACKKETTVTPKDQLSYGESVFYLQPANYTIFPQQAKPGSYTAYPDNLLIDNATGAITIALKGRDGQSQTGLKYKIKYKSPNSDLEDSTFITISGINYLDAFHYLAQNDSIIAPTYNANNSLPLPGGNYAIGVDGKLAINPANGNINVNESIRRGFFDDPAHSSWKQVTIKYALNDRSHAIENQLDIILYRYNSTADVPTNVSGLMQAHQSLSLGLNTRAIPSTPAPVDNNLSSDLSLFKPRPPCIVIIGH